MKKITTKTISIPIRAGHMWTHRYTNRMRPFVAAVQDQLGISDVYATDKTLRIGNSRWVIEYSASDFDNDVYASMGTENRNHIIRVLTANRTPSIRPFLTHTHNISTRTNRISIAIRVCDVMATDDFQSNTKCALARAITRQLGVSRVRAYYTGVYINDVQFSINGNPYTEYVFAEDKYFAKSAESPDQIIRIIKLSTTYHGK